MASEVLGEFSGISQKGKNSEMQVDLVVQCFDAS